MAQTSARVTSQNDAIIYWPPLSTGTNLIAVRCFSACCHNLTNFETWLQTHSSDFRLIRLMQHNARSRNVDLNRLFFRKAVSRVSRCFSISICSSSHVSRQLARAILYSPIGCPVSRGSGDGQRLDARSSSMLRLRPTVPKVLYGPLADTTSDTRSRYFHRLERSYVTSGRGRDSREYLHENFIRSLSWAQRASSNTTGLYMTRETALVFPKRYLRVCLRCEYSMEEH